MRKILIHRIYFSLLLFAAVCAMLMQSCKKNNLCGTPVITHVRNYAESPKDTIVTSINMGQWVVLVGKNLSAVTQVTFGGISATINTALYSDTSLVVQLPTIPFQSVPADKLNKIMAFTECGSTTFDIKVSGPPLITRVRNVASSPNDTLLSAIVPGQTINLIGFNLKNATSISFQGVLANLANIIYTDTSAIIKVPTDLSGSNAAQVNLITYTTSIGSGTFSIMIIGPPIVTRVSLENPLPGDSVYLYGNNFISVQNLSFAGVPIASYNVSADNTRIGFVAPTLTQSAPVSITAAGGSFSTTYNVNDIATGSISNFEWSGNFQWEWWGGAELNSGDPNSGWPPYNSAFPGNTGMYLNLKYTSLNPGDGADWSHAVRIPRVQWVPAASISDPIDKWVLKFEMSIPTAWEGGSLCIKTSSSDYMYRYEPWQTGPNSTTPFTTSGSPNKWETISIPLSWFRRNDATLGDGRGAPATSLTDILTGGAAGTSELRLYTHNYQTAAVINFNAAFDNFRVVKK